MKNALFIFILITCALSSSAQDFIKYPWGAAEVQTPADLDTVDIAIKNTLTIIAIDSVTDSVLFRATSINSAVANGARIMFINQQSAASPGPVRFGTALNGLEVTGVASDVDVVEMFYYNGAFYQVSEDKAVDASP